jgi:predicted aldo/keto reductase-like oxidoreductase
MDSSKNPRFLSRRDFLKVGAAAAATLGSGNLLHAQSTTVPVYRTLGRTGLKITAVSFGAMLTPEYEVIRAGLDRGINYVDTARRYLGGRSEEIVAKALKGIRDKVYVATKTGATSKAGVLSDVETSLTSLQTDHIDVIQLHGLRDPERAFVPEIREALLKLREQGKVRFFGVTTHTNQAEVINGIVDDRDKFFDVVLAGYSFKAEPSLKQAIARAAKAGIGVIAMKTQAGGYKTEELGSMSPHQAALKWVLQDTNVTAAIPGMKTLGHIDELLAVMGMRLTGADRQILRKYSQAIDPYYCRLCGQCESTCPRGVEISVINRALMYAEGYGEYALAKATFDEVAAPFGCASCVQCVAKCAFGLDVAAKMRSAGGMFA